MLGCGGIDMRRVLYQGNAHTVLSSTLYIHDSSFTSIVVASTCLRTSTREKVIVARRIPEVFFANRRVLILLRKPPITIRITLWHSELSFFKLPRVEWPVARVVIVNNRNPSRKLADRVEVSVATLEYEVLGRDGRSDIRHLMQK
jgi:hypothetical protein